MAKYVHTCMHTYTHILEKMSYLNDVPKISLRSSTFVTDVVSDETLGCTTFGEWVIVF